MADRRWPIILTLMLAACQVSPTPLPTPDPLQVALVSPPLRPLAAIWLQDYNQETSQIAFNLNPMVFPAAMERLENGTAAIYITSQIPPSGWWATPVGSEPVAVVTHSSNPVEQLTRSELVQIFSGQATDWEPWTGQSTPIEVIFPLPGDEIRDRFMERLSPGIRPAPSARLSADPAMAAELIADDPGRIGILPYSLSGPDLNLIRIDDTLPDQEGYPFIIDLIATAPQEPEGPIRRFLVWLQSHQTDRQPTQAETQATSTPRDAITPSPSSSPSEGTSTPPPTQTTSASQAQ